MDISMGSRERLYESARIAEQAELYEDMVKTMKDLVMLVCEEKGLLAKEERNLLSVAYKNVVGSRRSAYRTIAAQEQKQEGSTMEQAKIYKEKIADEVREYCNDVIGILDKLLEVIDKLSSSNDGTKADEHYVFYVKMKGDYYRYLSEVNQGSDREEVIENSRKAYKTAFDYAKDKLEPTHPIRLGLALNFSVFHYEIMNAPEDACKMAKSSFDEAIANLDKLKEDVYKDSTLIMQLLRDNLTLWADGPEEDEAAN